MMMGIVERSVFSPLLPPSVTDSKICEGTGVEIVRLRSHVDMVQAFLFWSFGQTM